MGVVSLAITLLLAQGYAPGRAGTDPLDPAREERVTRLGKQLRCVVCRQFLSGEPHIILQDF